MSNWKRPADYAPPSPRPAGLLTIAGVTGVQTSRGWFSWDDLMELGAREFTDDEGRRVIQFPISRRYLGDDQWGNARWEEVYGPVGRDKYRERMAIAEADGGMSEVRLERAKERRRERAKQTGRASGGWQE